MYLSYKKVMFFLFGVCTFFAQPVYAQVNFDGFWTTSLKITSSESGVKDRNINIELTIAGNYGRLRIEPGLVHVFEDTTCEYYFAHKDGMVTNIVFKPGEPTQLCGKSPIITFARIEQDSIHLSIKNGEMILDDIIPLQIRHGMIPNAQQSQLPENFDILDIELGMLRDHAELRLMKRGYEYDVATKKFKGDGWTQKVAVYKYGASRVYVMYSAVPGTKTKPSQESVILVSRQAEIDPGKQVTPAALKNSISQKYGPKTGADMSRYYDFDGTHLPDETKMRCSETTRQSVKVPFHVRHKLLGGSVIDAGCSSSAQINIATSAKTGLVVRYDITLWNNDFLIENDWHKVALETISHAKLYLGTLSREHMDIDL